MLVSLGGEGGDMSWVEASIVEASAMVDVYYHLAVNFSVGGDRNKGIDDLG